MASRCSRSSIRPYEVGRWRCIADSSELGDNFGIVFAQPGSSAACILEPRQHRHRRRGCRGIGVDQSARPSELTVLAEIIDRVHGGDRTARRRGSSEEICLRHSRECASVSSSSSSSAFSTAFTRTSENRASADQSGLPRTSRIRRQSALVRAARQTLPSRQGRTVYGYAPPDPAPRCPAHSPDKEHRVECRVASDNLADRHVKDLWLSWNFVDGGNSQRRSNHPGLDR